MVLVNELKPNVNVQFKKLYAINFSKSKEILLRISFSK